MVDGPRLVLLEDPDVRQLLCYGRLFLAHPDEAGPPLGHPGARLWVRERWLPVEDRRGLPGVRYAADGDFAPARRAVEALLDWRVEYARALPECRRHFWPAAAMPRWASRLEVVVADVSLAVRHGLWKTELRLASRRSDGFVTFYPPRTCAAHGSA